MSEMKRAIIKISMKNLLIVGNFILVMLCIAFWLSTIANQPEITIVPKRDIQYDLKTHKISFIEEYKQQIIGEDNPHVVHEVQSGMGTTDMINHGMNVDGDIGVATIFKDGIPGIYVYNFYKKTSVPVDENFISLVLNEKDFFEGKYFQYYWAPTQGSAYGGRSLIVEATNGYTSRLFVFAYTFRPDRLTYIKEVKFPGSINLDPLGWIQPSSDNGTPGTGFVVEVITNQESLPNTDGVRVTGRYLEVIGN